MTTPTLEPKPEERIFYPSRWVRLLLVTPLVLAGAVFWAPVGIITVFKIQSFEMAGPYWFLFLGLCVAACLVKGKTSYWAIYAVLAGVTVLNAVGGLRFFDGMRGMH
jgi:hypothetical protein